ncbi:MAG: SpoIIE family protein phosphatase [Eisenbergiella sp.]
MISGELYLTCSEKAPFTMRTGASQRTCGESALCGDTFETFRDGRGRQILLISDGMGTGGRAAVDAAMASGLFSKLVKSGLGFDTALRIVNSMLCLQNQKRNPSLRSTLPVLIFIQGHAPFAKRGRPLPFCAEQERQSC